MSPPRVSLPGAIVLALASLLALPAGAGAPSEDPSAEVERLLRAPFDEGRSVEDLARELVVCGPEATRPLLDALSGTAAWQTPLQGARREAVLQALAQFPRSRVVAEVSDIARGDPGEAERVASLQALASVAEAMDVALLVRLGAPSDPEAPRSPATERAFDAALGRLLSRRPAAVGSVASQMRQASPRLFLPMARQIARCRAADSLELLAAQLSRVPGAEGLILAEVEALAPSTRLESLRRARPGVRDQLDATDPLVCVAACRAVAALEDPESVQTLLTLLHAREEVVRAAALDALESLTGQLLGPAPEPWERWYAAELEWWRGDGQRHLQIVRLGLRRELAQALMGLGRGRLFREEIAPSITPLLRHPEPDVARLSASILASLGSRAAVPALADVLTHADPGVAGGAHKALRRITGRDLGTEPSPWLDLPH